VENITVETVQYSSLTDIDEVEPLTDRDHSVLTELRDVLRKHAVTDRFGVCLLHRHFDLNDDEVLVESTDPDARVSTLTVARRNSIRGRSIETVWRFSKDRSIVAGTECRQTCEYDNGHLHVHIKVGV
jgi:hypothetical protein